MRIRTIKPEFWESENLGRVSRDARLLFVGLFSCCDDSGVTRAGSRLLASRLFPYDEDALKKIPAWLKELEAQKCIRAYVVDGETYLDIPKWLSHQKIDRPSASKFPRFESVREDSRGFENCSLGMGTGNGNREQGAGSPPVADSREEKNAEAKRIIQILNEHSGRSFRATESNFTLVNARLAEEGVTADGVIAMVRRQCLKWKDDPKMSEFLRPETLFGKTKFESYYSAKDLPIQTEDKLSGKTGQLPMFETDSRAAYEAYKDRMDPGLVD
jgi:uncharacterized phage protein (TIGR02220 family)